LTPPDTPTPSSPSSRDAVAERLRTLLTAHGVNVRYDSGLNELLAALKIGEQIPVEAFAVVTDVLFHLLADNQRQHSENAS
jgi:type III secretion system FlhB-like substrate exporter